MLKLNTAQQYSPIKRMNNKKKNTKPFFTMFPRKHVSPSAALKCYGPFLKGYYDANQYKYNQVNDSFLKILTRYRTCIISLNSSKIHFSYVVFKSRCQKHKVDLSTFCLLGNYLSWDGLKFLSTLDFLCGFRLIENLHLV